MFIQSASAWSLVYEECAWGPVVRRSGCTCWVSCCSVAMVYGCVLCCLEKGMRLSVQAPGLLLTPHIGGAVVNIRVRGYRFVLKQIERYISGQPLENLRLHGY